MSGKSNATEGFFSVSHDAQSEELHRCISVINNEFFNSTAHLDKLSLESQLSTVADHLQSCLLMYQPVLAEF